MRSLLIFGASCSLGFLFWRLLHVRVSVMQHLYVGYVLLCTLLAPFVLRYAETHKKDFALFFAATMVPAAFMAQYSAVQWSTPLHYAAELIIATLTTVAVLALNAQHYAPKHFSVEVIIAQGFFFLFAGVLTLVSMFLPTSAVDQRIRTAFGLYWTWIGVWSFVSCIWIARSEALFRATNERLPMIACIVFALGLSAALQGQVELGRQNAQDEQITELIWEAE